MKPLLLIGGAALVAWYFLNKQAGSLGYSIGGGTSTGGTGTGTGTGSGSSSGASSTGQLAAIQSKLLAAAMSGENSANPQLSADQWGFYYALNTVAATPAPAPQTIFGARWRDSDRSVDGSVTMSFQTYWQALAPYLHSQGMSGLSGVLVSEWAV